MTQGISSSLNLTLARLNAIESNFQALENVMGQINSTNNNNNIAKAENNNFQSVLDGKIKEDIKKENKPLEEIELGPIDEYTKKIEADKKEEINLKSKVDLMSQKANIDEIIETFAQKYNIDGNFIKAMIKQESGFNPNATSKKGAMGLMQLMPSTAKSLGVVDAYNPWENIEGGVKYIKGLMDRFNNDEKLALAAYNAGPNAVKRYGGIPPYKETQNYVKSIMSTYEKLKGAKI